MSEKKDELIDLSAMENLEPAFLGEVKKIDDKDIKEIKEEVIDEVESLEEFLKDKSKKEVDDEEEEVEKVETTEDTDKETKTETINSHYIPMPVVQPEATTPEQSIIKPKPNP